MKRKTYIEKEKSLRKLASIIYKQIKIIKQIGLKAFFKYLFIFRGHKVCVTINGIEIFIRKGTPDLDVAISCFNGEFEALRFLLPSEYNGVIVDAGGYIGTASIALHQMFPNASILCIEPSSDNIKILEKNTQNINNIEIIPGALVAGDNKTISLKNRGTGEWGYTTVANPLDNNNSVELHESPAVNLLSLGVDIKDIGILKLDIEGGEVDLFVNDKDSLEQIPNIIIELHDRIILGCSEEFFKFSKNRIIVKDSGEKFLSIKK